jgi:hypothetical protein
VINIAIVVVILLLVGAIVVWLCDRMGLAVPDNVRKLYMAVVALIGLRCWSRSCSVCRRFA